MPQYLTLGGSGRVVEVGAFLAPEERLDLHADLPTALRDLAQAQGQTRSLLVLGWQSQHDLLPDPGAQVQDVTPQKRHRNRCQMSSPRPYGCRFHRVTPAAP